MSLAFNFIFDGRPGGTGSDRQLTIRSNSLVSYAFFYPSSSGNNTIRFCTLEGANKTTTGGVVGIGSPAFGSGNNNNTITQCVIHDNSLLGAPANGIYSSGLNGPVNSGNSITYNEISNFTSTGILVAPGNAGNWNIFGNSFYNTSSNNLSTSVTAIDFRPGTSSNDNNIGGNNIGGSAASAQGSMWTHTGANGVASFTGILVNVGSASGVDVHDNLFNNLGVDATKAAFNGVMVTGGFVRVLNNTLGLPLTPHRIELTSTDSSLFEGVNVKTCSYVEVKSQLIAGVTMTAPHAIFNGITCQSSDTTHISDNIIDANSINSTGSLDFTGIDVTKFSGCPLV